MKKLFSRGVKKLFIPAEQEPQYLSYLEIALDQLIDSPLTTQEKGLVVNDILVTEAENVPRSLESESSYQRTRDRVQKIVEFLTAENGAVKSILEAAGASTEYCQHSANVATLSLGLAIKSGMNHHQELLDLAIAGLIHDIGRSKLGFDSSLPKSSLTEDELIEYRKHPQLGVDLIADKRYVTPRVLRLIVEHEEIGEKEGFPEGKKVTQLPSNSQILNLCNDFDRYSGLKHKTTGEIVQAFINEKSEQFSYYYLSLLKTALFSSENGIPGQKPAAPL